MGCFRMDEERRIEVNFVLKLWPLTRLLPAQKSDLRLYCLQIS
ncbi:hypothetical protein EMIT0P260_90257 [Pseudomonas sp. IT-P260]